MKTLPFLLILSLMTGSIEVDISIPSFPDISDHFAISDGLTQMTMAINFFGFFISSAFYGPLSDAFGRRKIMIIGNGIMLIGASGCVFADNIYLLLLSRLIQGLGASTSAVVAFAMIADVYSEAKSSKIIGIMNSFITIFMSIAPIMGGFINNAIGWRGNYATVAMVSLVSWLVLYLMLPETNKNPKKFQVQIVLKDFKTLLSNRSFVYSASLPSLSYAAWMMFVSCCSFLYMETYELPMMEYVLHQGAIIITFSIISMFSGRIHQFIGYHNAVMYGLYLMSAGSICIFIVSILFPIAPYLTTGTIMIFSSGAALSYPVIFSHSLQIFPEISGAASSLIMAIRSLICAFFIAISSYFYYGQLWTVAAMILLVVLLCWIFTLLLIRLINFDITSK